MLALSLLAALAHDSLPINPLLGEPGFPDCAQALPSEKLSADVAVNAKTRELMDLGPRSKFRSIAHCASSSRPQ